ncbi:MAG: hypothetical protein AAF432_03500 [Planctomycetota bacterium]
MNIRMLRAVRDLLDAKDALTQDQWYALMHLLWGLQRGSVEPAVPIGQIGLLWSKCGTVAIRIGRPGPWTVIAIDVVLA